MKFKCGAKTNHVLLCPMTCMPLLLIISYRHVADNLIGFKRSLSAFKILKSIFIVVVFHDDDDDDADVMMMMTFYLYYSCLRSINRFLAILNDRLSGILY